MNNPRCSDKDKKILLKALRAYETWVADMDKVTSSGKDRVVELTKLLNQYKDHLEAELVIRSGSHFLIRQKG